MMKRHLVVFSLFLLIHAASAQQAWIYPPDAPIPQEASEAFFHATEIRSYAFEESRDIYLRLANENPGTALGGDSLCAAMYVQIFMNDPAAIEATRQRLIAEYPGSRYEVYAKRFALQQQFWGSLSREAEIAAYSNLLEEFGAPRLEALYAGQDLEGATRQALALPFEIRLELADVYYHCVNLVDQREARINLAKFGHQAFGTVISPYIDFRYRIQSLLGDSSGKVKLMGSEDSLPLVEIISPSPNSLVDAQPSIKFRLSSGDYRKSQVSLNSLSLKLDGEQQINKALIHTEIDESLEEGVDFEVLTLSLEPTLAPGTHTVEVTAQTGSGPSTPENTKTVSWSFIVSGDPPGPTTETLPIVKDALIYEKSPHANEGANPRLTLEKITGKAARNLLGFDLSGVNTQNLTKATLVLTIDSSSQVTGWGNGETVSLKPVTTTWQEGNGKKYDLPNNQQSAGSGSGVTWFSPIDSDISNNVANSATNWSGGASFLGTGSTPALTVGNHQSGELRFDVTLDVKNGVPHGWLLRKDAENKGSKVSFYSKEGAAAAGDLNLAPRLIVEYGGPTAHLNRGLLNRGASAVASFLGIPRREVKLREVVVDSELPTLRDVLRRNPTAALVGERIVFGLVAHQPLVELGARAVYCSWLQGEPRLG